MSADGYLEDESTRHAVYVQLYAAGQAEEVATFIVLAINTAKARVAEGLSTYGTRRYEQQIRVLQKDLAGIQSEMKGQMLLNLGEFAGAEAKYSIDLLGQVVKASVQLGVPSPEIVKAAALSDPMALEARKGMQKISISGALDEFGAKKSAEILSEINIGSALGEPTQVIARRLNGLHQLQRDQATALVRTMTNHIASTARAETLKENDDILKGWRWISTLDSRTSKICMSRDQKIYGWDDPRPPAHWNCRSSTIPVLKDEYHRDIPGSTRPSVGSDGIKPVKSDTTYSEWLARQSAAFQKDVLGPARYKLFSKGELTLDKFVNDNGRTLTLDQLRERNPLAFEKAGLD